MLLLLRDLVAVQAIPEIARCLQHASAQVRLAAFQTLGTLDPNGDGFLQALKHGLDDDDPKVFRAAVTYLVATPDQGSLQLASRLLFADSSGQRGGRQVALLRVIEQTGNATILPLVNAVARHHMLRFWSWGKTRAVRSAAARASAAIRARNGSSAGSSQGASHVGPQDPV
jgi:hypothetical protein